VVYQGADGSAGYDADGDVVAYQYRNAVTGEVDQYAVTYLRKDGYLQSTTSGENVSDTPNVRPSTDESVYDDRGNLVALTQHTQYAGGTVADTVRVFAYDGNGEIIERQDGTADGATLNQGTNPALENQHYVYVNGQQVAHYDDAGTVDVLSEVTAFSSSTNGPNGYVVQAGDTLESIAQAEYGDASLWYVLAQANALSSDSDLSIGQRLTIPQVTTSSNTATTYKPYDPSSIVGSTTPSLPTIAPPPPPASSHCNALADIIVIAVTIVATVLTEGATSGILADELGAVGSAVLSGAIAGAAGSVAGQLTGDVLGVHQGLDLGAVAENALEAGITQGVGVGIPSTGNVFADGAISGAIAYVGNDVAAKLTDQPAHFSWAGLVAESLSNAAYGEIQASPLGGTYAGSIVARAADDVVDRETSIALGDNHVQSWTQIGEDVAGNALANAGVAGIRAYQANSNQQTLDALNTSVNQSLSSEINGIDRGLGNTTANMADQTLGINGQSTLNSEWQGFQFGASGANTAQAMAGLAGVYGNDASSIGLPDDSGNPSGLSPGIAYSGMPLSGHSGAYVDFLTSPDDQLLGGGLGNAAGTYTALQIGPSDNGYDMSNLGDVTLPKTLPGYSSLYAMTPDASVNDQTDANGTPYLFQADRLATNLGENFVSADPNQVLPFNEAYPYDPASENGNALLDSAQTSGAGVLDTGSSKDFNWISISGRQLNDVINDLRSKGNSEAVIGNVRHLLSLEAYRKVGQGTSEYTINVASQQDIDYRARVESASEYPGKAQAALTLAGFDYDQNSFNKLVDISNANLASDGLVSGDANASLYVSNASEAGQAALSMIPASYRDDKFQANNIFDYGGEQIEPTNGIYIAPDDPVKIKIGSIFIAGDLGSAMAYAGENAATSGLSSDGSIPGLAPSDMPGPANYPGSEMQENSNGLAEASDKLGAIATVGTFVSNTISLQTAGRIDVYYDSEKDEYSYTVYENKFSGQTVTMQSVSQSSSFFKNVQLGFYSSKEN